MEGVEFEIGDKGGVCESFIEVSTDVVKDSSGGKVDGSIISLEGWRSELEVVFSDNVLLSSSSCIFCRSTEWRADDLRSATDVNVSCKLSSSSCISCR